MLSASYCLTQALMIAGPSISTMDFMVRKLIPVVKIKCQDKLSRVFVKTQRFKLSIKYLTAEEKITHILTFSFQMQRPHHYTGNNLLTNNHDLRHSGTNPQVQKIISFYFQHWGKQHNTTQFKPLLFSVKTVLII